jgi:hypothetical protein
MSLPLRDHSSREWSRETGEMRVFAVFILLWFQRDGARLSLRRRRFRECHMLRGCYDTEHELAIRIARERLDETFKKSCPAISHRSHRGRPGRCHARRVWFPRRSAAVAGLEVHRGRPL